jgi:acetyl esterase/lipase
MAADQECFVYVVLPGDTQFLTAGRFELQQDRQGRAVGAFVYGRRYRERPEAVELDPVDPWLAIPGTHAAGALYRAELPEIDPFVSPIHGSLRDLGPITMFSGTRDILNADAHRLVQFAAHVGHPLEYHEAPGMVHVYPLLPIPEGRDARARIVEAITR